MIADNKRIAKNTLILYGRMLVMMLIGLYTSRVILQNLGVDDYGIYGAVGGIVGFMGFLNAALATSSSRFLTFSLGKGDLKEAKNTFSTTLTIHVLLGFLIFIIGEAIGPWLIDNKLIIPVERLDVAHIAFQFSLITISVGVSQVPYSATIVAHEKMGIYAYMAIWDVLFRLAVALSLVWWGGDKLVFFAAILCMNSLGTQLFYRIYCARKFPEAVTRLHIDKTIFKEIAQFSGWSLLSSFVFTLCNQGTTILMSMFFSPALIAAKAIAEKVRQMTTQFIGNFRQAANPQIIKLYAQGDYEEFRKLTLNSAKFSFFIMWVMALAIIMNCEYLLKLWLGDVPDYAVIFVQLVMIDNLSWLFDASFNEGIIATGKLKRNTILTSIANVLRFPILYFILKTEGSPLWVFYITMIAGVVNGYLIRPYVLIKQVNFKLTDFFSVYWTCIKVVLVSLVAPLLIHMFLKQNNFGYFVLSGFVCILSSLLSCFYMGMTKGQQNMVICFIRNKINKK